MMINLIYPTSWDQVTKDHLLILGELMEKTMTREELLFSLLCKITGIKPLIAQGENENTPEAKFHFSKDGKKFKMDAWMIRQASEELLFMIESIGLPMCPIDNISNKLYDLKFEAFYFADAYMTMYQSNKKKDYILSFYSSLTGRKIRSISPAEINAITIWWCGLKTFLKETYPDVLKESEDDCSDKSPADMLYEVLSILNNNEPQKNKEILASDVHAVMHSLNNIFKASKNAKH